MVNIRHPWRRFSGSESCPITVQKSKANPPHVHPNLEYVTACNVFSRPSSTLVGVRRPGYDVSACGEREQYRTVSWCCNTPRETSRDTEHIAVHYTTNCYWCIATQSNNPISKILTFRDMESFLICLRWPVKLEMFILNSSCGATSYRLGTTGYSLKW